MKKTCLIIISVFLFGYSAQAQNDMDFFTANGAINNSELLNNDLSYTLAHINNRADDVVWAHVVYSIIDLRDNRNAQLAFPAGQDMMYKNLFRVLSEAVTGKVPVYYPNESGISPDFSPENLIPANKLSDVFFIETDVAGIQYIDPLFETDSASNTTRISARIYDRFSKGINKFLIQKVYYFDKHLSVLSSKIIGIAPLKTDEVSAAIDFDGENDGSADIQTLKNTLKESVICWFLTDDLKPRFGKQLVYQDNNIAQRISYDEYFSKKMFSDYLIGDNNLLKRLYGNTEEITFNKLNEEINKIRQSLIAIESGLWD